MILQILADTVWQVGAFVAATLWCFYSIEDRFHSSGIVLEPDLPSRRRQIVFGAMMGIFPGCGGAIIVVTQYVKGRMCFASLVSVLTATMGDAVFLLIATRPLAALIVLPLAFASACLSGLCVDSLHPADYLRPKPSLDLVSADESESSAVGRCSIDGTLWSVIGLPVLVIAVLIACQVDPDILAGIPMQTTTTIGGVLGLTLLFAWAFGSVDRNIRGSTVRYYCTIRENRRPLMQRVADDTNFVMSWVAGGLLAFELLLLVTDIETASFTGYDTVIVIFAAIMVGWIPGCGPQILTTSLYLSGAIPFSAQLGNAISNDGDSLFPAIALAPRAALVGTMYSTVPALFVSYGYFYLFES